MLALCVVLLCTVCPFASLDVLSKFTTIVIIIIISRSISIIIIALLIIVNVNYGRFMRYVFAIRVFVLYAISVTPAYC